MKSNPIRKIALSFVLLFPLLVVAGLACGNTPSEGVVALKSITGVRDGVSQTVLDNRPGDTGSIIIHVKAEDLLEYFQTDDEHAIIDDSLAFVIESRYDRVDYFVIIRSGSAATSETQPYTVSRSVFNRLLVGQTVEFEVNDDGEFPTIERVIATP